MSDEIKQFIEESGRGTIQNLCILKNKLDLPGGRRGTAWLCAVHGTLWIAAMSEGIGRAIEAPVEQLNFTKNFWGSALRVGERTFPIPLGSNIRDVVAAALLYDDQPFPIDEHLEGEWISTPSVAEKYWLEKNLVGGEQLIAFLETATKSDFPTKIAGSGTLEYKLLMTDQRCGLLGLSELGESTFLPLTRQQLQINKGFGRAQINCGPQEWLATLTNPDKFEQVSDLIPLESFDRIRSAAMRLKRSRSPFQAKRLFGALQNSADPLDRFISAWMYEGEDLSDILAQLMQEESNAKRLQDWVTEADLSTQEINIILKRCFLLSITPQEARWSLGLHELKMEKLKTPSPEEELEFIEHLFFTGHNVEDRLQRLLEHLPNEEWQFAIPKHVLNITNEQAARSITLRANILLGRVHAQDPNRHPDILRRLARCEPLSLKRAREMQASSNEKVAQYGREIIHLLEAGELTPKPESSLQNVRPLQKEDLEIIRHPITRSSGVLNGLQTWLADIEAPDYGLLQAYCEQITIQNYPKLYEEVQSLCKILNMPSPPVYISWGKRSTGLRSHEEPEPFLLIGGEHLSSDSGYSLTPSELRSLLAMELTHLKLKHSRVTSDELWRGVISKGAFILGTTASLLPLIKHVPSTWLSKIQAYDIAKTIVPNRWLQKIYEADSAEQLPKLVNQNIGKLTDEVGGIVDNANTALDKASSFIPNPKAENINVDPQDILFAHRAMQFSADRAAVLCTQNPIATIHSIFLSNPILHPHLASVKEKGLLAFLLESSPQEDLAKQDLMIRSAAIIAFYLSDEYQQLCKEIQLTSK
ncbi:MAG: hypothetical protein VX278_24120 [Myxococcota bacterium]|nr:hypothetical protein [Myxococcota bacterium]